MIYISNDTNVWIDFVTIEKLDIPFRLPYTSNTKLSIYDRIALAIAKCRNITLLTGDGALRKAAKRENVAIMGTLGLLDQLWDQGRISSDEFESCLQKLLDNNGKAVRLPKDEIQSRLAKLSRLP